jgi:type I restriction enzyme R subunit
MYVKQRILQNNFDQVDPDLSLRQELERIFQKKNLSEVTQADMIENMHLLQKYTTRPRAEP